MSPLAGPPAITTLFTAGVAAWLPSTLWFAELATAWLPRPNAAFAVPSLIRMAPPLFVSAPAPMLMPSASRSDACTT